MLIIPHHDASRQASHFIALPFSTIIIFHTGQDYKQHHDSFPSPPPPDPCKQTMNQNCFPPKEEEEQQQPPLDNGDDREEALSLRDLPLTAAAAAAAATPTAELSTDSLHNHDDDLLPSPESEEYFEFFTKLDAYCCSADDIIFSGRLLPFAPSCCCLSSSSLSLSTSADSSNHSLSTSLPSSSSTPFQTRRSESLNESRASRTKANRMAMMRPSRSLDYRILQRSNSTCDINIGDSSSSRAIRGGGSIKSSRSRGSYNWELKEAAKFPWYYWSVFGMARFPVEMELKDMRYRQLRRHSSSTMPPKAAAQEDSRPGDGTSQRKDTPSWRLISALSCKNHGSVAVTTSFRSVPDVCL
ncbi:hypothetical protein Dimus_025729 [Dionaea muscipula]